MLQCDLLDMPAVGQLEKDAKYASVYQLLKIFLTQRLDAYLEFQTANSTSLKSYGKFSVLCDFKWAKPSSPLITYAPCNGLGLVHEDCITKMRLMSLVDLASDESGQIPYALIRDTLRVNLLYCSAFVGFVVVQLHLF